jgi:hypothetical protein
MGPNRPCPSIAVRMRIVWLSRRLPMTVSPGIGGVTA